jgi:hypothetical protein
MAICQTRSLSARFPELIPARPWCSDDPRRLGLRFYPKTRAVEHRYIQINAPWFIRFLPFDIDREGAAFAADELGLPPPTWSTTNPASGHAHLAYELTVPVFFRNWVTGSGNAKSTHFLRLVKAGFARALRADPAYAGLLTQNPVHSHWNTLTRNCSYSLEELANELPREFLRASPAPPFYLGNQFRHPLDQIVGRNVDCFECCRKIAYRITRECGSQAELHTRVLNLVGDRNRIYSPPMLASEVRAIAGSISRFCWRNRATFSTHAHGYGWRRGVLALSSDLPLKERHRRGAEFTHAIRACDTRARIDLAIRQLGFGASVSAIAESAAVSRRTVSYYRAAAQSGQNPSSPDS